MKKVKVSPQNPSSAAQYLTFVAATGDSSQSVEMRYEDENIWLTQKMMAELYDVSVSNINQHLKRLKTDGELDDSVIKQYLITAADGKDYNQKHYSLQLHAEMGFEKYRIVQDGLFESDFDRFVELGKVTAKERRV